MDARQQVHRLLRHVVLRLGCRFRGAHPLCTEGPFKCVDGDDDDHDDDDGDDDDDEDYDHDDDGDDGDEDDDDRDDVDGENGDDDDVDVGNEVDDNDYDNDGDDDYNQLGWRPPASMLMMMVMMIVITTTHDEVSAPGLRGERAKQQVSFPSALFRSSAVSLPFSLSVYTLFPPRTIRAKPTVGFERVKKTGAQNQPSVLSASKEHGGGGERIAAAHSVLHAG